MLTTNTDLSQIGINSKSVKLMYLGDLTRLEKKKNTCLKTLPYRRHIVWTG